MHLFITLQQRNYADPSCVPHLRAEGLHKAPVGYVRQPHHQRQVANGVAHAAALKAIGVLTNQVARQEAAVRAANHGDAVSIRDT